MQARKMAMVAGLAGALSLVATAACARGMTAQDFVSKASVANQFEIDSSRLALDKSQNGEVKSFARRMVDDHTKIGEKLKEVLQSSGSKAKPEDHLDDKHRKLLDTLKATGGDTFDNKYIAMQTDAHEDAVKLFGDYSRHGKDPALKDFAAQTLPTLRDHLKHVEHLNTHR